MPSSGAQRIPEAQGSEPAPQRRERNAVETQLRIVRAAEVEFARKGFDGARLGQIARAAEVQQALIHHYFHDKEGLYRAVVDHAVGAMSVEGWEVLHRLLSPLDASRVPEVVRAFVDLLVWQSLTHASAFAILRHAAAAEGAGETRSEALIRRTMRDKMRPLFDAVVALIEEMRAQGHVRSDVEPRHLCISVLSLALLAAQDDGIVRAVWNVDVRSPDFIAERKQEIVATVLARILPTATPSG
ncbi:TetR/AcrR family transcriptional regulator [Pendulispora albinea]|uniref:TetR/AcrR family transcriptional regulator n=1 Tax=Pendulispora albinea TaxID=2741071 RepID=A0ABZ2LVR3_9BACT